MVAKPRSLRQEQKKSEQSCAIFTDPQDHPEEEEPKSSEEVGDGDDEPLTPSKKVATFSFVEATN